MAIEVTTNSLLSRRDSWLYCIASGLACLSHSNAQPGSLTCLASYSRTKSSSLIISTSSLLLPHTARSCLKQSVSSSTTSSAPPHTHNISMNEFVSESKLLAACVLRRGRRPACLNVLEVEEGFADNDRQRGEHTRPSPSSRSRQWVAHAAYRYVIRGLRDTCVQTRCRQRLPTSEHVTRPGDDGSCASSVNGAHEVVDTRSHFAIALSSTASFRRVSGKHAASERAYESLKSETHATKPPFPNTRCGS
jgi:hypothetical protein